MTKIQGRLWSDSSKIEFVLWDQITVQKSDVTKKNSRITTSIKNLKTVITEAVPNYYISKSYSETHWKKFEKFKKGDIEKLFHIIYFKKH